MFRAWTGQFLASSSTLRAMLDFRWGVRGNNSVFSPVLCSVFVGSRVFSREAPVFKKKKKIFLINSIPSFLSFIAYIPFVV